MKLRQTSQQIGKLDSYEIEAFVYPATADPPLPSWEAWDGMVPFGEQIGRDGAAGSKCEAKEASGHAEWEARIADEARHSFEAGRQRGIQEGRAIEREAHLTEDTVRDQQRMDNAARAIERFESERSRYFEAVEHEVVKLALAVAARILRREAQMDPLLLTGAVRVALGQLSRSIQVRLHVPAAELELWAETIAHLPNLVQKPMVVAGEGMRLGDCLLETEQGSVDLGVRAQLGEIERGFFDAARAARGGTDEEAIQENAAVAVKEHA